MSDSQETKLQWHSAFYAGIQIEFEKEADKLIFENEHYVGTKPKQIDVLVIKKQSNEQIRKNIGRIFRTYNIIEYKSPDDSLSIDDFYLVYAYTCLYKADSASVNKILAEEITISFVCSKFPRELVKHLKKVRNYATKKSEDGVYYIEGDFFPIQIIYTKELSEEYNFWLRNLRNNISKEEDARKIVAEYQKHTENPLYASVMNVIIAANKNQFLEVTHMCEALEQLFEEKLMDKCMKICMEKCEADMQIAMKNLATEKDAIIKTLREENETIIKTLREENETIIKTLREENETLKKLIAAK